MRATRYMIAAIALALPATSPMVLAARPTRSIPRETARRAALPATLRGASRERAARRTAGAGPGARVGVGKNVRGGTRLQAGVGSKGSGGAAVRGPRVAVRATSTRARGGIGYGVADASAVMRVHAWEQAQRYAAAHAAISVADGSAARASGAARPGLARPGEGIPEQDEIAGAVGAGDAAAGAAGDAGVDANRATGAGGGNGDGSVAAGGLTAMILPPLRVEAIYDESGRLMVPAPLYGSREVLLHQNEMADRDGLERVRDDADLERLQRMGRLVELPETEGVRIDERLPADRRYSRPWTAEFLSTMARDFYASFHSALLVDSAVRTVAVQRRLLRTNGNAAPISGDTASPHLTGEAIDIGKGGLSLVQIAWMRAYLQPLMALGQIDVEEEFQQACFHISVYRSYLAPGVGRVTVAAAGQTTAQVAQ